ncbi:Riboflavin transporter FmnP [Acetoanaerobium noterae]|uniref:Riboflavin transporter n=1 Tax=Acetoanaerobium noterae TaxID=745369 RepID=A0A1T5D753_9FIRM|nr:ECF transporter S component [Acetoanaerobium noterae]SKB67515.1 Riboflavin transporter FmnP [Acetoanaerobium noterae]
MEKAVTKKQAISTSKMVKISILGVMSFILMFMNLPLPIFPAFLKIDFADIPSVIGGFALGPVAGIMIQLIKNILHFMFDNSTGGVGEISNFIVGGSFVLVSSSIYHAMRSKKGAIIGSIAGTIVMAMVGALSNYFLIISFYSNIMPIDVIINLGTVVNSAIHDKLTLVLYGVIPFNIFKGIVISVVTALLYKKVTPILKKR